MSDDIPEIKRIDIKEFREQGYLQEINRLFLHPLGLALEVMIKSDGTEYIGGVWDSREDPEGIHFGDFFKGNEDATKKANFIQGELVKMAVSRKKILGYAIQPVDNIERKYEIDGEDCPEGNI